MQKIIVNRNDELYNYLRLNLMGKSKNNIKSLLKNGNITVNDQVITKYNYSIKEGDVIIIGKSIDKREGLRIIYEDDNIIVIDKPSKILSIANDKEKEETLYRLVSNYLKKEKKKVFIIHRLDYDTSGVIMFAKKQSVSKLYQDNWNNIAKEREYVAVVEGRCDKGGTITSYLKQTKTLLVYSSKKKDGLFAITNYQKIKGNDNYSLLKINIETGRRNQIRCHMADIKHPIAGDTRYKARTNPIGRLALHAAKLVIEDPLTAKIMTFESSVPKEFMDLVK